MSKKQQNDTDLLEVFQENLATLSGLINRIQFEIGKNDPLTSSKLKALKEEFLLEDVKLQEFKIEKITSLLDEICSPQELSKS